MKLEYAIKQTKPFANPYQKAMVNLLYTNNYVKVEMQEFFKSKGLTMKQYNIMRILKGAGQNVSTSYIKERMLEKNSDVSRIVDRMHDKGIVIKSGCPNDKRLIDVALTPHGKQLLQEVTGEMDAVDSIFQKLSTEEIEMLNTILDKIRE